MLWTVYADDIKCMLRVGIYPHEEIDPQPVIVRAKLVLDIPAIPSHISECFDYNQVLEKIWNDWQTRPQMPLIEPLAAELAEYLLLLDSRLQSVTIGIFKPEAWKGRANVGVEITLTPADLPLGQKLRYMR